MMDINTQTDFLKGSVLLIDKPFEWTSFDVVNKVRILLQNRFRYRWLKVGHTGTLDPLATGLIILCTGNATKEITRFLSMEKEYIATICLGKSTYARCGIIVNVTPFEPEWEGHVTIEISNTTPLPAKIYSNEGIETGLTFSYLFLPNILGKVSGRYEIRNYTDLPAADENGNELDEMRQDNQYSAGASLEFGLGEILSGLYLSLNYNYIKNISNDYYYDYNNQSYAITLGFDF